MIREPSGSSQNPNDNREVDRQSSDGSQTEQPIGFLRAAKPVNSNIDTFPAIFLLDSDVCVKPLTSDFNPLIPSATLNYILSPEALGVYERYFSTVHQWMPILSKKRAQRNMAEAGVTPNSPPQLLLLCMDLVSGLLPPGVSARTNRMYNKVLESLFKVENSYLPCIQFLQSVILLSVYEISHGIYPAAYLHVGNAARLCVMMGFHDRKNAAQLFKDTATWTAREEERRAWWAVLCLDRYSQHL